MKTTNKGYGAIDTLIDPRDYHREHFFGSKVGRPVPEDFDHSVTHYTKDQANSMACTLFSTIRVLEAKFFLQTGFKIEITDEEILEMWKLACSLGCGDEKKGAYLYDPLKFLKDHPQVFRISNGTQMLIGVDTYFDLSDSDEQGFWEEVYYGGGVLTGTSSRLGLFLGQAKFKPFYPKDKKANVNDGHAFPVLGKKKGDKIHPNSWGKEWGDDGKFYTRPDQEKGLFRAWGFTIKHALNDTKSEENVFSDVGKDSWAYDAIKFVKDKGLMNGYKDGQFYPNQPITRAEFAVVIERLINLQK